jgi:hypothetical protein
MKRPGMKRPEMKCPEMKGFWDEMSWDKTTWDETSWDERSLGQKVLGRNVSGEKHSASGKYVYNEMKLFIDQNCFLLIQIQTARIKATPIRPPRSGWINEKEYIFKFKLLVTAIADIFFFILMTV